MKAKVKETDLVEAHARAKYTTCMVGRWGGAKANAEVKENDLMEAHAKVNSTTVMVGWWGGWAKGKGESKGKCNGKT